MNKLMKTAILLCFILIITMQGFSQSDEVIEENVLGSRESQILLKDQTITKNQFIKEVRGKISDMTFSFMGYKELENSMIYICLKNIKLQISMSENTITSMVSVLEMAIEKEIPVIIRYEENQETNIGNILSVSLNFNKKNKK